MQESSGMVNEDNQGAKQPRCRLKLLQTVEVKTENVSDCCVVVAVVVKAQVGEAWTYKKLWW
jgi:hypothetical protein